MYFSKLYIASADVYFQIRLYHTGITEKDYNFRDSEIMLIL